MVGRRRQDFTIKELKDGRKGAGRISRLKDYKIV
jgi:hypothetical protein